MKSLFERAINIRHGCLESRLVARMETEGRELTDEETANELEYLAETIPYAGLGKEYEKEKSHSGIDTDSHAFHRTSPNCICGNCRSDACDF
jgi:hypothetical protein